MSDTTAWIRPLAAAPAAGLPARREVRGSACRTNQGLFAEWAETLAFPNYFGHNWDAFRDCLRDAVTATPPLTIVVREADQLLADEPGYALEDFLATLSDCVAAGGDTPGLLLLLDDTADRLPHLAKRLAEAGFPPWRP